MLPSSSSRAPVALSFSDHDLTDTYPDGASSIASNQGDPNRHPRGDSPFSALSNGDAKNDMTMSGMGEMPSLDKLMAFLDEDDRSIGREQQKQQQHQERQGGARDGSRSASTSRGELHSSLSPHQPNPAPGSAFKSFRSALTSSSPPLLRPTPLPPLPPSPSPSHSRTLSYDETATLFENEVELEGGIRSRSRQITEEERENAIVPESPSPLPWMLNGNASGRSAGGGLRRREDSANGSAGADKGKSGGRQQSGGSDIDETPASIRRLAEDVLNEFETIISRHSPIKPTSSSSFFPNSHSNMNYDAPPSHSQYLRPPSRLRNIPSPTGSSSSNTSKASEDEEGEEGRRGEKVRVRLGGYKLGKENEPQTPIDSTPQLQSQPPTNSNATETSLILELKAARAYIHHLQTELKEIGKTVVELQWRRDYSIGVGGAGGEEERGLGGYRFDAVHGRGIGRGDKGDGEDESPRGGRGSVIPVPASVNGSEDEFGSGKEEGMEGGSESGEEGDVDGEGEGDWEGAEESKRREYDVNPADLVDVARHILSLLSPPLTRSHGGSKSATRISSTKRLPIPSLSRSLQFVRSIDELVYGHKRDEREIFSEGNLKKLGGRVRSWERSCRT